MARAHATRLTRDDLLPTTARLRFVTDATAGIVRERARAGFRYRTADGRLVRETHILDRIRVLAIPPAWERVWICTVAVGHLQATGRDARGRKQYRYHPAYRAGRDREKYGRLAAFGRALPRIRAALTRDLARPGLPRDKVLAAVVRLLDRTHLRVGNAEYVRANGSFGLSTLQDRHVTFGGAGLRVRFRGKGGIPHDRSVTDRVLARVVRQCRDLPGQELFQYLDSRGVARSIGSADVNGYLRRVSGGEFTAKDFRTWAGTVAAAAHLSALPTPETKGAGERLICVVVKLVADQLGNTPAVCRKSYVHPLVLDAFRTGDWPRAGRRNGLSADESRVQRLLERTK